MPTIIWIKKLILPPAGPLLLCLGALVAAWLDPLALWPLWLLTAGLLCLYLLSLTSVGFGLLRRLESHPFYDPERDSRPELEKPQVIVVLDAGRYVRGDGPAAVKPETLDRLQHGAWLHRRTGLPILVSGDGAGPLMDEVLRESFGLGARWIEPNSRNTQENAFLSAELLRRDGFDRIALVTHVWHMPRAVQAFQRAGLRVTPAPMGFSGPDRWELRLLSFIPSVTAWTASHTALHEWIGLVWYRLRYGASTAGEGDGPSSNEPKSSSTRTVA